MQSVENVKQNGGVVVMDGKFFLNCHFENCTLLFTGEDFGWSGTRFEGCTITLDGSARRTIAFLKHFGMFPQKMPDPLVHPPNESERSH